LNLGNSHETHPLIKHECCSVHRVLIIISFKQFDVALSKFKDFTLWPARIIKTVKDKEASMPHDKLRLVDANLEIYDPTAENSSIPAAKKAFSELATDLDIFKSYLNLPLHLKSISETNLDSSPSRSISSIHRRLVTTQGVLDKTKNDLMENITQRFFVTILLKILIFYTIAQQKRSLRGCVKIKRGHISATHAKGIFLVVQGGNYKFSVWGFRQL